jgi:hypothetical protein
MSSQRFHEIVELTFTPLSLASRGDVISFRLIYQSTWHPLVRSLHNVPSTSSLNGRYTGTSKFLPLPFLAPALFRGVACIGSVCHVHANRESTVAGVVVALRYAL